MTGEPPAPAAPPPAPQPTPQPTPQATRWPILATIFVAAAVATMIGLGVWQLQRAKEKTALIALYQQNMTLSSAVMLPMSGPVPRTILYRHASAQCLRVTNWKQVGGRDIAGTTGFRFLAECSRNAEGPGFVVDMGVGTDPAFQPSWTGGPVEGVVTEEPVEGGLWAKLMGHAVVPRPMIVSGIALPGLKPTAPPNPADVPNNHLAYAGQWFFFAACAAVIYILALRRRRRDAAGSGPDAA
jgi:cytochrome oxidase assembly protein ShyY1